MRHGFDGKNPSIGLLGSLVDRRAEVSLDPDWEAERKEDGIEVVSTAADPYMAATKLKSLVPDVIILDIEMPRMDGLTFLKRLMSQHPLPVIICSSKSEAGSQNAMTALEYGAVDIIKFGSMAGKLEHHNVPCSAFSN